MIGTVAWLAACFEQLLEHGLARERVEVFFGKDGIDDVEIRCRLIELVARENRNDVHTQQRMAIEENVEITLGIGDVLLRRETVVDDRAVAQIEGQLSVFVAGLCQVRQGGEIDRIHARAEGRQGDEDIRHVGVR